MTPVFDYRSFWKTGCVLSYNLISSSYCLVCISVLLMEPIIVAFIGNLESFIFVQHNFISYLIALWVLLIVWHYCATFLFFLVFTLPARGTNYTHQVLLFFSYDFSSKLFNDDCLANWWWNSTLFLSSVSHQLLMLYCITSWRVISFVRMVNQ